MLGPCNHEIESSLASPELGGLLSQDRKDHSPGSSSAQIQRSPRLTQDPGRRGGFEDIFTGVQVFQQSG
jgi:hypothetical protein